MRRIEDRGRGWREVVQAGDGEEGDFWGREEGGAGGRGEGDGWRRDWRWDRGRADGEVGRDGGVARGVYEGGDGD